MDIIIPNNYNPLTNPFSVSAYQYECIGKYLIKQVANCYISRTLTLTQSFFLPTKISTSVLQRMEAVVTHVPTLLVISPVAAPMQ